jgi:hypothetical protein
MHCHRNLWFQARRAGRVAAETGLVGEEESA